MFHIVTILTQAAHQKNRSSSSSSATIPKHQKASSPAPE
jgi:hypothetical protein